MSRNKEFLNRMQYITNPDIEAGINSGNPYTICDLKEYGE